ncbi:sigma-54 interacting transcriptional regulator [Pseudoduganella lurida]|uniref:Sigma-54 interacting transcriptional regulator n=1 Tax=Pseudoduganella lurida TaxID=1036180 RepID=A0A562RJW0_9BURK|nr:sigma 54-interacting transcriptional regulator [Pseudoduganella lurida]TWI69347.1 sigma-54 interacting transcriptional regulator [Pseudoduganella lurida]
MPQTLWMHPLDPASAGAAGALHAALASSGLVLEDAAPGSFGIVLCSGADDTSLATLAVLAERATVLAIDCARTPLPPDAMWRVLAAGATDLLAWTTAALCAQQVAARLARWSAVQELMASSAVRGWLVGDSPAWRTLVHSVVEVAAFTRSPVLITGETGTGKDLIAQLIHQLAGAPGELTVLDCTTLSPELAGSELFGHERGAFTGAVNARDGAFAQADGGILFLDEVGELPLPMQAQLLRVIQERKYKRVGSNTWQPSRFRLVCATNRDLEAEIANGTFRADLYYRIAAWRCRPPPLRERPGDILPLVEHFLRQLDPDGPSRALDAAVRDYLLTREYKGNVRDLRQTVARLWHRHTGPGPITIGDVPPDERPARVPCWPDAPFCTAIRHAVDRGVSLARIGQAATDMAIRLVLEQEDDNNQRAAQRLGVTDRALQIRRKAARDADGVP